MNALLPWILVEPNAAPLGVDRGSGAQAVHSVIEAEAAQA